jgi:hypothetical protein
VITLLLLGLLALPLLGVALFARRIVRAFAAPSARPRPEDDIR